MENINVTPGSAPTSVNQNLLIPKPNNIYKILFFLFFFISLGLGTFYYLSLTKKTSTSTSTSATTNQKESSQPQETKTVSTTTWQKPISTAKIIPIVKDQKLNIYSIADKKLQPTNYKTGWGSGALDFGEDNPLVSPDGKLIVFINKDDNDSLYLISDANQKALKITEYPVKYLNS